MNDGITVYRGRRFDNYSRKQIQKVLVLDLDDTLGSFSHLHILWTGILKCNKGNIDKARVFTRLFSLYPEFLRDNIRDVLREMKAHKQKDTKIFLYTNNQCQTPGWVDSVVQYIEDISDTPELFDQFVRAFKIKNCVVEPKRTSMSKSLDDLINCTSITKPVEICFIDDRYYPNMIHDNVYYIHPVAYYHSLSIKNIIDRYVKSSLGNEMRAQSTVSKNYKEFITDWFEFNNAGRYVQNSYTPSSMRDVTTKLIFHINKFFASKTETQEPIKITTPRTPKKNTQKKTPRVSSTKKSRSANIRSPSTRAAPDPSTFEK